MGKSETVVKVIITLGLQITAKLTSFSSIIKVFLSSFASSIPFLLVTEFLDQSSFLMHLPLAEATTYDTILSKLVGVSFSIMYSSSIIFPRSSKKYVTHIHWHHITNNFIFVLAHLKFHFTLFIY